MKVDWPILQLKKIKIKDNHPTNTAFNFIYMLKNEHQSMQAYSYFSLEQHELTSALKENDL